MISRILTQEEIEDFGIYLMNISAAINFDGIPEIWFGKNKIPPWERDETKRNLLHTSGEKKFLLEIILPVYCVGKLVEN